MKTAREILYQVDKDGIRKYWIGTFGTEKKMDLKDVYRAMEEYASHKLEEYRKGLSTSHGYSRDIVEAAFLAGRSKTSWAQFKKDHGIKQD